MKKLYHPATPCKGASNKEISLEVLVDSKNLEIIPCSEGFQIFSEGHHSYWIDKLSEFEDFCRERNINYEIFNRNSLVKGSSWFSHSPIELELEVTKACNQSCLHCYNNSGKALPNELSLNEIKRLIDEFRLNGGQRLKITGGEPLMRQDIFEILQHSKESGVKSYEFTTNGTLIDSKNTERLKQYLTAINISMNGNEEFHEKITGLKGSFKRAVNAISLIKEKGLDVNLYFTVMKENISQIPFMVNLALELDAPIRFSLIRNIGKGKALAEVTTEGVALITAYIKQEAHGKNIKLMRSEVYTKEYGPENAAGYKFYGCNGARHLIYSDAQGNFYPCSLNPTHLGSFRQASLSEIWSQEQATKFREAFCECDKVKDCGGKWLCGGPCKEYK